MQRFRQRHRRATSIVGLALLLLGAPGLSRAAVEVDLADLELEDLLEIEITSVAKKPQRRVEASQAVTVLTHDEIQRSGVRTIPDALRLVPGVQVARIDANKWAIGIRGFASRLARSVLVLADGPSVYTPLFAGTYWEVQDTLLENIDRISSRSGLGS